MNFIILCEQEKVSMKSRLIIKQCIFTNFNYTVLPIYVIANGEVFISENYIMWLYIIDPVSGVVCKVHGFYDRWLLI